MVSHVRISSFLFRSLLLIGLKLSDWHMTKIFQFSLSLIGQKGPQGLFSQNHHFQHFQGLPFLRNVFWFEEHCQIKFIHDFSQFRRRAVENLLQMYSSLIDFGFFKCCWKKKTVNLCFISLLPSFNPFSIIKNYK